MLGEPQAFLQERDEFGRYPPASILVFLSGFVLRPSLRS